MIDLKFEIPEGNVPPMICNSCGNNSFPVYIGAHPDDEEILIPVCSESCRDKIKNHPMLQQYLDYLKAHVGQIK